VSVLCSTIVPLAELGLAGRVRTGKYQHLDRACRGGAPPTLLAHVMNAVAPVATSTSSGNDDAVALQPTPTTTITERSHFAVRDIGGGPPGHDHTPCHQARIARAVHLPEPGHPGSIPTSEG
jgi:hypothetical protein